jgi:nitrite reductase (NO-forming)
MQNQTSPRVVGTVLFVGALVLMVLAAVGLGNAGVQGQETTQAAATRPVADAATPAPVADAAAPAPVAQAAAVVEYTLRTRLGGEPSMAFVGVGGEIDGLVNPELVANVGDTVRLTVINGDPVLHDLTIAEFGVTTGQLTQAEQAVTIEFVASQAGVFEYYCSIPGHREIGMKGVLRVVGAADVTVGYAEAQPVEVAAPIEVMAVAAAAADAVSVVRNPADLPPPVGDRGPQKLRVDMTTVEVNGILADGATYRFMTFDGKVPGPMLRLRVGDTVELHLHNQAESQLPHSIDLHAVTGPGGGAVYAQTLPGQETVFTFQALQPGLYVYHCATPSIGHHISSGMYGLVLVEPEGGLPPVDHEFYIMQGELYTAQPFGTPGQLDFSHEKMLDEDAEYFLFNGAAGALTSDENALHAAVGDTVRIYFGVGGPNATSSLHLIGEIFDHVYDQASLTSTPLSDVQTTTVAPGGATVVEFTLNVPGRYILVDHALSRLERGLAGYLNVDGEENPAIFHGEGMANMAGH